MRTIEVLAKRHDEWVKMAMSFGLQMGDARELTQEMYIRMDKYKPNVKEIMYNETEVNTFYVYTALSNLFHTGYHETGRSWRSKKTKVSYNSPLLDIEFNYDIEDFFMFSECPECYEAFIKKNQKLKVEASDVYDTEENRELEYSMTMFESLFGNLKEDVKGIVSKWYWYDRKLFRLHFPMIFDDLDNDGEPKKPMSMRKIAKETGISLKSVFNSLKAAKMRIREEFQEDYNKYKKSLEV